jgi:hypothetical protein
VRAVTGAVGGRRHRRGTLNPPLTRRGSITVSLIPTTAASPLCSLNPSIVDQVAMASTSPVHTHCGMADRMVLLHRREGRSSVTVDSQT